MSYHRRAVLKDEFPEKNNCIFGISMVDNLRRRWDLERVPLIISKKKFSKLQWILMRQNEKKIHASHWIRTSVAFAHAVYKPVCCMRSTSLFLFSYIVHLFFKIIFLINESKFINNNVVNCYSMPRCSCLCMSHRQWFCSIHVDGTFDHQRERS
jgi:hypothetical protein